MCQPNTNVTHTLTHTQTQTLSQYLLPILKHWNEANHDKKLLGICFPSKKPSSIEALQLESSKSMRETFSSSFCTIFFPLYKLHYMWHHKRSVYCFFFLSFLSLFIGIGDLYPFKLLLRLKFFFWAKWELFLQNAIVALCMYVCMYEWLCLL